MSALSRTISITRGARPMFSPSLSLSGPSIPSSPFSSRIIPSSSFSSPPPSRSFSSDRPFSSVNPFNLPSSPSILPTSTAPHQSDLSSKAETVSKEGDKSSGSPNKQGYNDAFDSVMKELAEKTVKEIKEQVKNGYFKERTDTVLKWVNAKLLENIDDLMFAKFDPKQYDDFKKQHKNFIDGKLFEMTGAIKKILDENMKQTFKEQMDEGARQALEKKGWLAITGLIATVTGLIVKLMLDENRNDQSMDREKINSNRGEDGHNNKTTPATDQTPNNTPHTPATQPMFINPVMTHYYSHLLSKQKESGPRPNPEPTVMPNSKPPVSSTPKAP